jgi:hypothetical protein
MINALPASKDTIYQAKIILFLAPVGAVQTPAVPALAPTPLNAFPAFKAISNSKTPATPAVMAARLAAASATPHSASLASLDSLLVVNLETTAFPAKFQAVPNANSSIQIKHLLINIQILMEICRIPMESKQCRK